MKMFGFNLFTRDSGGGFTLASYHPKKYQTWIWTVSYEQHKPWHHKSFKLDIVPKQNRYGQWFHYFYMGEFGKLILGRQNYHK